MTYDTYINTIERFDARTISADEKYALTHLITWSDIETITLPGEMGVAIDEAIANLIPDGAPLSVYSDRCREVVKKLDPYTTAIINAYIKKLCNDFPDKCHLHLQGEPSLQLLITLLGFQSLLACAIGVLTENPMLIIYAIDAYFFNLGTGKDGTGVMGISLASVRDYVNKHQHGDTYFYDDAKPLPPFPFYKDGDNNYCYDSNEYTNLLFSVDNHDPIDTNSLFPALINGLSKLSTRVGIRELEPATKGTTMFTLTDNQKNIIDAVLKPTGAPSASELIALANECAGKKEEVKTLEQKVSELTTQIATLSANQSVANLEIHSTDATIPSGTTKLYDVANLFPELKKKKISFTVAGYEWNGKHPHVPEVNHNYVFNVETLLPLLMGIANGENIWLSGHTGTGKTTLIEQVCAKLNYPLIRVAFDHAIDRYELMGTTTLISDGKGGTKSQFNPGILEQSLPNGYVLLCDELDCARPDSLYVMQDVLEHKTKFVLESNDDTGTKAREIHFHPMSRIIATGNTKGNGDQFNLYPACRTLSAATLDRFTTWIEVDYLSKISEKKLLKDSGMVLGLNDKQIDSITEFARCMRDRFINGTIPVSFSPRRELQFAKKTSFLMSVAKYDFAKAARVALQAVVIASADKDAVDSILSLAQVAFGIDNTKAYKNVF